MRFPSPVAIVVFALVVGLVGPVEGKGGKGGGGGGSHAHAGHGGATAHTGGGQGGSKHQLAQSKHPTTDKVASGKPDKQKFAKEKPAKEKLSKEKTTKEKTAKEKTAKEKAAKEKESEDAEDAEDGDHDGDMDDPADDGEDSDETTSYNKKEHQLANFQRQRDKKLAQAEHLRQIAERNGNQNLLANADRMEAQAYEQYARKVSHLEKFGVTDPALDLDGDGFADPWSPTTGLDDPLIDPLDNPLTDELLTNPVGTLRSLLPFGR